MLSPQGGIANLSGSRALSRQGSWCCFTNSFLCGLLLLLHGVFLFMWETGEPGVFVQCIRRRESVTLASQIYVECITYHIELYMKICRRLEPRTGNSSWTNSESLQPLLCFALCILELSSTTQKGRRYYLLLCMKGSAHLRNSHTVLF
jgi:hypothetical protein